jgi:hypothetical protein
MELIFGMPAIGTDGAECGSLRRVLVDPDTREITHVVVLAPRVNDDVLLPLSMVQGSTELRLVLHVASGDLEQMPRYDEGRITSPPAGRVNTAVVREPEERRADLETALAVPPAAREYGPETAVISGDETGQLLSLAADQYTNRVSELRASGLLEQDVVVPDRWIGDLRADAIVLDAATDQLDQLIRAQAAPYVAQQSGSPREVNERTREPGQSE